MSQVQAKMILDNPLFRNIIKNVGADIHEDWKQSESAEEREALFLRQKALEDLMTELNNRLESEV